MKCRESLRVPIFQTKGCVNCKKTLRIIIYLTFRVILLRSVVGNPENHSGHKTRKTHIV